MLSRFSFLFLPLVVLFFSTTGLSESVTVTPAQSIVYPNVPTSAVVRITNKTTGAPMSNVRVMFEPGWVDGLEGPQIMFMTGTLASTDPNGVAFVTFSVNPTVSSFSIKATAIDFSADNTAFVYFRSPGLTVNSGLLTRSNISTLDISLWDPNKTTAIINSLGTANPRIKLARVRYPKFTTDLTTKQTLSLPSLVSAPYIGVVRLDYANDGRILGGQTNSTVWDGVYQLEIDEDGDGVFENSYRFGRLLGDATGLESDGFIRVDNTDSLFIQSVISNSIYPLPPKVANGDMNFDGKVNALDLNIVIWQKGRWLKLY